MKYFIIFRELFVIGLTCTMVSAWAQQPPKPEPPNTQRYEVHQSFLGSAYFKDDNIWIYNQGFAQTFGMPASGVVDIKGAEAVAFRVETMNYRFCGFGGKDENCTAITRPILDVYIDERKTQLPWVSDQQADWLGVQSSVRWLRLDRPDSKRWHSGETAPPPKGSIPNSLYGAYWGSLRPFMDGQTKEELVWRVNDGTDRLQDLAKNDGYNFLTLLAFKRQVLNGLTVLSFQLGKADTPGSPRELTLRLQAKDPILQPSVVPHAQIVLPPSFVEAMKRLGQAKSDEQQKFYRSLFQPPLGGNPIAKPITPIQ